MAAFSLKDQRDYVALSLALLTLLIFWRVGGYEFITFDDPQYVFENPQVVSGISWENAWWAFGSLHGGVSYWHPVTWLSHQLDCELFGLRAGLHHLTNLLFHMTNSILLFVVLFRTTGALGRSGVVAALFAIHPLHVESVAWIAERKDVLSCFFWLLATWSYTRYVEHGMARYYWMAVLLFALGLMSKPMMVTFPCALLLMDIWPLGRVRMEPGAGRISLLFRLLQEKAPFFVLSVLVGIVTIWAQKSVGTTATLENVPWGARVENAVLSYGTYVLKTFWPFNLAVLYPFRPSLPTWQVAASALALTVLTAFFLSQATKRTYLIIGWLWFLVTLVPVIGIIQVGPQAMADRYTYIPLIGLFIILVWGGRELIRHALLRRAATALAVAAVAARSSVQLDFWKNSETLYRRTLALVPDNPIIRNNLGSDLYRAHRFDEARLHLEKVVEGSPGLVEAWVNLGNVSLKTGAYELATNYYGEALRRNPGQTTARLGLALVMEKRGRTREAIDGYREVLASHPDSVEACLNLGRVYARHAEVAYRNATNAAFFAERACQLTGYQRPDCLELLAAAYAEMGRFEDAVITAHQALALSVGNQELTTQIAASLRSYRARAAHPQGTQVGRGP